MSRARQSIWGRLRSVEKHRPAFSTEMVVEVHALDSWPDCQAYPGGRFVPCEEHASTCGVRYTRFPGPPIRRRYLIGGRWQGSLD
jgi:hypothetical protein